MVLGSMGLYSHIDQLKLNQLLHLFQVRKLRKIKTDDALITAKTLFQMTVHNVLQGECWDLLSTSQSIKTKNYSHFGLRKNVTFY